MPKLQLPRRAPSSATRLAEFETLYRTQVAAVTAFFARRSRDPEVVADLTADTFVEAMKSFGASAPARGSERAWLFAIARRVYARYCERSTRARSATRREGARRRLNEDEIEELVERIDAQRSARELLERLPEHDRDVIELVDLGGLTPKEAASALGVSPGTLRVRLFRARSHMRKEHKSND